MGAFNSRKREKTQNLFSSSVPMGTHLSPHCQPHSGLRVCYHLVESHSFVSQRTTCLKLSSQEGNASPSCLPSANRFGRFALKAKCPITSLCCSNLSKVTEGRGGFPFLDSRSRHWACVHTRMCSLVDDNLLKSTYA